MRLVQRTLNRIKRAVISIVSVCALLFSGSVVSADNYATINTNQSGDTISIVLNGVKQNFSQPPVIEQGSILVPMWSMFEKLDAEINWDKTKKKAFAKKGQNAIIITLGSNQMAVNGKEKPISVPAKIIKGNIMVPLTDICGALGANVKRDANANTVYITSVKASSGYISKTSSKLILYGDRYLEHVDNWGTEGRLVKSLEYAVSNLQNAINKGKLNVEIYDEVLKRLVELEELGPIDGHNRKSRMTYVMVLPFLIDADIAIKWQIDPNNDADILEKREQCILVLNKLQEEFDIAVRRFDRMKIRKSAVLQPSNFSNYTKHHYGSANQEEFNTVIDIINDAILDVPTVQFPKYYSEYLDGARWSGDRSDRSERNVRLAQAEGALKGIVDAGVSRASIEKAYKVLLTAGYLIAGRKDPKDGTPRSAYDNLVRKVSDCDSDAEAFSAFFDAMGYNTMIIASPGHAEFYFQIEGNWYDRWFRKFDLSLLKNSNLYVYSPPTFGPLIE